MAQVDQSIKDKILKLLSLSTSDNPNEASIALSKAQELLSKYKLTPADCVFARSFLTDKTRYSAWQKQLWYEISYAHNCYATVSFKDKHAYLGCVGKSLDVFCVKEMYRYCIQSINRISHNASVGKGAAFYSKYRHAVALGLISTVRKYATKCSWSTSRESDIQEAGRWLSEVMGRSVELYENKVQATSDISAFMKGASISLSKQAGGIAPTLLLQDPLNSI